MSGNRKFTAAEIDAFSRRVESPITPETDPAPSVAPAEQSLITPATIFGALAIPEDLPELTGAIPEFRKED